MTVPALRMLDLSANNLTHVPFWITKVPLLDIEENAIEQSLSSLLSTSQLCS